MGRRGIKLLISTKTCHTSFQLLASNPTKLQLISRSYHTIFCIPLSSVIHLLTNILHPYFFSHFLLLMLLLLYISLCVWSCPLLQKGRNSSFLFQFASFLVSLLRPWIMLLIPLGFLWFFLDGWSGFGVLLLFPGW